MIPLYAVVSLGIVVSLLIPMLIAGTMTLVKFLTVPNNILTNAEVIAFTIMTVFSGTLLIVVTHVYVVSFIRIAS